MQMLSPEPHSTCYSPHPPSHLHSLVPAGWRLELLGGLRHRHNIQLSKERNGNVVVVVVVAVVLW